MNLNEELSINTGNSLTDARYRHLLVQIFTSSYLAKIDRVFKDGLTIKKFKEKNNVMALTTGTEISVNSSMYNNLSPIRANVYLIHETFHVLQNMPQFRELVNINAKLCRAAESLIPKEKINMFLTGKEQNIHSDYKKEFLSYYSNNVFAWRLSPELKKIFSNIITNAGIFNVSSEWWRKRL